MTALTINGSAGAATTLVTAGKLFAATGGTSGNTSTKVGASTGRKHIYALGFTGTSLVGAGAIPAPTDANFNGWMWDVTTLEEQRVAAGTYTPTFHLLASTGTTVTPTVEWFKRSSAGVYTSIGSVTGSSIALTTSSQLLTFTPPSLPLMDFATGDKLVMWLWVNQTAGGGTNSTISVVEAISGSTFGTASEAQTATPGYASIPVVGLSATCAGVGAFTSTDFIPSVYTLYGTDSFVRANQSGWGTASDGEPWAQVRGVHTPSIASNAGLLTYNGTNVTSVMQLGVGKAYILNMQVRCQQVSANTDAMGIVFRFIDANNHYKLTIGDTANTLTFSKDVASSFTTVSSAAFTTTPGTWYRMRVLIVNQTVYGKIWQDGTSEPATWQINGVTDAGLTASGGWGLCGAPLVTGHVVQFDTLTVDNGIIPLTGECDGIGTLSGTLSISGGGALSANLIGVGTESAQLSVNAPLTTQLTGVGVLAAPLSASVALSTTSTGTATLSGAFTLTTALSATETGIGVLTAALSAAYSVSGTTLVGSSTLTGTSSVATALATSLPAIGTLTASISLSGVALTNTLVGVGVITGQLSAATALTITLVGSGVLTPSLVATQPLSATLVGVGVITAGAPTFTTALTTSTAGVGTLTGSITTTTALASTTMNAVGVLTGVLATGGSLSVTLNGISTLVGAFTATTPLTTTLVGIGASSETVSLTTALVDTLVGVGALTATIGAKTALTTSYTGIGTLAGTITIPGSVALSSTFVGIGVLTTSAPTFATALTNTLVGAGTLVSAWTLKTTLSSSMIGVGTCNSTITANTSFAGTTLTGIGVLSGVAVYAIHLNQTLAGTTTLTSTFTAACYLSVLCMGIGACFPSPRFAGVIYTVEVYAIAMSSMITIQADDAMVTTVAVISNPQES